MQDAFRARSSKRLPRRRLIDSMVDCSAFHEPHARACGAGHSYPDDRLEGWVSACQMEIERPLTNVLVDDPLTEIRLHDATLSNLSVTEKEGCRDGPWRYWCAGGCTLLTLRVTGRTDVRSPYCEVSTKPSTPTYCVWRDTAPLALGIASFLK